MKTKAKASTLSLFQNRQEPESAVKDKFQIFHANCMDQLASQKTESVDAIVCDPPYEIAINQKDWDKSGIAFNVKMWSECLRVLKKGGHLIAFAATRLYHRLAVSIETAGFEIRDQIIWGYLEGMPKSYDVSTLIDKKLGNDRAVVGKNQWKESKVPNNVWGKFNKTGERKVVTESISEEGKKWNGWAGSLKPAHEPAVLARKPLYNNNYADNLIAYGVGALNIDACRISDDLENLTDNTNTENDIIIKGRWPSNIIGDEDFFRSLDIESKYFFVPKASAAERDFGLTTLKNIHVTVKPIALMEYLIKLVTPKGGIVLDPFLGSGTTGIAAMKLQNPFIGIELDEDHYNIAKERILYAANEYWF